MKLNTLYLLENLQQLVSGNRAKELGAVLVALLEKNKFKGKLKAENQRGKGFAVRGDFGPEENIAKKFNGLKDWKNKSLRFDLMPVPADAPGSLSGTYTTWVLVPKTNILVDAKFLKGRTSGNLGSAKKSIDGEIIWKAGEGISVVNATAGKGKDGGKRHFKTKDLVPDKFGLAGQTTPTKEFAAKLITMVENKFPDKKPQAKALGHIIERVNKGSGNTISLDKEILKAIENDVGVVAKDFGEIAGALWFAKREKADAIFFPAAANEPLVDYSIITKGVTTRVSAKAGRGGPPSVKAIPDILDDLRATGFRNTLSAKEQKAADTLRESSQLKVVESIIFINQNLDTIAWKELNKMIPGGVSNAEDIESWIRGQSIEEVLKELKPFYAKIGSSSKAAEKILKSAGEKKGIILAPMGAHAKGVLNSLPEFDSVLNKALKTVTVVQVFLDMKLGALKFTVRPFADGDFQFDYNGVASLPSNRGFSFRMKKGTAAPGVATIPTKESFIAFYLQ